MKSHLYRMPKDIGRINHAGEPVWGKSGVIIFLVVGLSMLDAVTLYSVFDKLFYQSPAISMVLTFGCALCLNFVPLLLGRYIHLYRYRMKGVRLWMLLAWLGVFLLLFAATFNLRWQTRSMGFDNSSAALVDITGQNETVKEENAGNDKEAVAATLLLGLLPGITSCVNLGLGYLSDDPVKREIEGKKVELSRLRGQLAVMQAAREELTQDWLSRLDALDAENLMRACDTVHETTQQIMAVARLMLSEKLGDPESINALTEPKLNEQT